MIKRLYEIIKNSIILVFKKLLFVIRKYRLKVFVIFFAVLLITLFFVSFVGCRGLYGVAWNLSQNGNQVTVADTHDDSIDMSGANINITDSDNVE